MKPHHTTHIRSAFFQLAASVVLIFASLSSFASEDLTPSGTNPTPRVKEFPWMSIDTWNKMYADDIAVSDKGGVDLLFVGDSITAGWNPDVWAKNFAQYHPANFGIGGDHTGNLLWRLKNGHAEKLKPKAVILLIGVNNFGHLHETPKQVADGVKACVALLRKMYPDAKILINSIFPFEEQASSPMRELVKEANAFIATLNDGKHIFVKNYGEIFLQEDGSISKEVMGDFLHPT
ncbi:MAG: mucin-desulfating sulfatase, partial [Moraxellaceae bacterium]